MGHNTIWGLGVQFKSTGTRVHDVLFASGDPATIKQRVHLTARLVDVDPLDLGNTVSLLWATFSPARPWVP